MNRKGDVGSDAKKKFTKKKNGIFFANSVGYVFLSLSFSLFSCENVLRVSFLPTTLSSLWKFG